VRGGIKAAFIGDFLDWFERVFVDECAMSLAEQFRQEGIRKCRQEGHQEGLIFSKQQDILEALEIRFQRVPDGLREEIETIIDTKKLTHLLRAAITSADLESFAVEL
jgi:predicted transposase YdaD